MAELNQRLEQVKETLDDEKKRKLQKWKRNLLDTVEHEGEEAVARRLENAHILQLVEDDFYNELEGLAEKGIVKSYLETNRDRIKDELPSSTDDSFEVENYEGLNKTELAKEMARHAIEGKNIIPVDRGDASHEETSFYKYNREEGVYEEFNRNRMTTLASKMAGKHDTRHTENEFLRNMKNSQRRLHIEELGLSQDEILVNNKKILDISEPLDPEIRTARPDDYAQHKINVTYSPDEDCPQFKKFIWQLFDDDREAIKTAQEFMGWLLKFPNDRFQKALLILGESNTGKSQLTEIIEHMFDDNSVKNLSMKMIGADKSFHVSNLSNKIINIDRDMASQTIDSPNVVKQVISQESLDVEDKGTDSYMIKPTAKHVICSNVAPKIENTDDDGFYSRFITLKAPNVVDEEDKIPNLGQKLFEEEASGILNWMLEGLNRLEQNERFTIMREPYQTKSYWNQYGNSLQKFIWYECEATGNDNDFIPKERLYEIYEVWVSKRLEERVAKYEMKQIFDEQPMFIWGRGVDPEDGQQKAGVRGIKIPEFEDMYGG